jgi:DNA-binding transcriptional regulator YdaS (Cro superfamily)
MRLPVSLSYGKRVGMANGMDLIRSQRGLPAKLAYSLGLTRAAVLKWKQVPAERLVDIERITGIPRHQLRPDICPPPEPIERTSPGSDAVAA